MSDTPQPDSTTWHPGEATDELFLTSEAALDAYARGDYNEGDRLSKLAHALERGGIAPPT